MNSVKLMIMQNKGKASSRNVSLDVIRTIAIFCVILVHCLEDFDTLYRDNLMNSLGSIVANFTFYLKNSGVPMFIMLSGALLLGREEPIYEFYKRRYTRLLIPFILWSIPVYVLSHYRHQNPIEVLSIWDFLERLFTDGVIGIYWYVYMTIGLYLLTPLLQRSFCKREDSEIYVRNAAWVLLTIYLLAYMVPELKTFSMFKCFMTLCLTLYVWGYYVYKYLRFKSYFRRASFAVLIIVAVALALNIRFAYSATFPFQYFLAAALFSVLLGINWGNMHRRMLTFFTFTSKVSYGIYLMHFLVVSGIMRVIKLPPPMHPIVYPLATLVVCCGLFYVIDKTFLRKYLM